MKIGLLIPAFNRPEYLRKCLWSLQRVTLPEDAIVLIINDGSTDIETNDILHNFSMPGLRLWTRPNQGIKKTLEAGYEILFAEGCDIVINFDSDAIIRQDAVTALLSNYISGTLLTGFHSTTRSANGNERHIIKSETETLYLKESVGGINFCIDKVAYTNYLYPVLQIEFGNWDHMACIKAQGAYCLKESVVQHIGFDSTLNHYENPDTADTFYYWHLPNVTLLCIDKEIERIQEPLRKCTEYIKFGNVQLLHPNLNSKEEYSNYCIDHMHEHISTSHVLVFQYDGFVNNWMAWDNDWLQYDYIGAPWHYQDGMSVGNGGFSLRSKRLMELASRICKMKHPEDHHICRTYRKELEAHGMRFAPIEVAEKFAFEGYGQPLKFLSDQFGVHGSKPRTKPEAANYQFYVFNQFLSLGDILFLVPMARALMNEGNEVLWPIDARYLSIAKHFPDIKFVDKALIDIDYEYKATHQSRYGRVLPYRFANNLMGRTLHQCMESKYNLFGHDHNLWRQLQWKRDYANEAKLIELVGAGASGSFNLVNRYFGHLGEMQITPVISNDLPCIEMSNLPGFTLIDWMGVAELATEIHVANSSMNYLLEIANIDIPVYLYKRKIWGEIGFEYTKQLWSNKNFNFVE